MAATPPAAAVLRPQEYIMLQFASQELFGNQVGRLGAGRAAWGGCCFCCGPRLALAPAHRRQPQPTGACARAEQPRRRPCRARRRRAPGTRPPSPGG
jgi:hypothetical protein